MGDIWLLNGNAHLNFRTMNNSTEMLAFFSDITSANSSLLSANNSWTGTNTFSNPISGSVTGSASTITGSVGENQVTNLTTDLGNLSGAITLETGRAMSAESALSGAITAETNRATAAETTLTNTKASLAGGNTFTGTQALGPLSNAASQPSNLFRLNANDASNVSQTAQLQALVDGSLSFQFGPTAGPISPKLNIDKNGFITFAAGQTFPGAQTLTAGTGISIVSNAINNTGVTSLVGTANQITASASTGAVTLSLPTTVAVNISGNAATATTATIATSSTTATSAATASAVGFNGITTGTNTTSTMTVGTGGSIVPTGTGVINATELGGVAAANYARTDQANTFTGANIMGNTAAQSGGLLIPPSQNGSGKPSFPFDMEAVNGANNLHLFRIIALDGGTPKWDFQFCNNNNPSCTPTSTGFSIASTGILTFAAGQAFPGTGGGTVTSITAGNGLTGGTITTSGTIALANSGVTAGTFTKLTVDATGRATVGAQAQFTDIGGSIVPAQVGAGTYSININGSAGSAAVATTATNASNLLLGTTVVGTTTWNNVAAPATPAANTTAVYVDSTTKKLCSKDDGGNVNCTGASAASSPSVFTSTGTTAQTGVKFIHGNSTLNNGGNLTVTFGTSFTNATSFDCNASDATNAPGVIGVQNQTANSIKISGTANHAVSFVCVGV
ncbi:MAG: hypothetical protein DMG96_16580 [Acidobacteria bacterium]|nr:MAG: hypothetical protein DMG96_16580 [Acidobacteriota bacterium]